MKRLSQWVLAIALTGFGVFIWLSRPVDTSEIETRFASVVDNNIANGAQVFWASGCASCHAKKGAADEDLLLLGGGHVAQG